MTRPYRRRTALSTTASGVPAVSHPERHQQSQSVPLVTISGGATVADWVHIDIDMVPRADHDALRAEFDALALRATDWIGNLAARCSNMEFLLHIRNNGLQDKTGLSFLSNFSPGAYDHVREIVREALLGPVEKK